MCITIYNQKQQKVEKGREKLSASLISHEKCTKTQLQFLCLFSTAEENCDMHWGAGKTLPGQDPTSKRHELVKK